MRTKQYLLFLSVTTLIFWACEEEPIVDTVVVSPSTATIKKGEAQQFTAKVIDENGDTLTDATVEWSSSDELIATVDVGGLASGIEEGVVTITATADGVSGTSTLIVELSPQEILPGTWATVSGESTLSLTTSSDQTAFNVFAEGEGAISVTGAFTTDLTYLFGFIEEDSGAFFVVTTRLFFEDVGEEGPGFPALVIYDIPSSESVMVFTGVNTSGDTLWFLTSPANYTFDESSGSLTIPATVLNNEGETDSVTVNGTLVYTQFSIPANTPTTVDFPFFTPEDEETTVTFEENGQFTRISTFTDEEEIQTETAEGSWQFLTDSTIQIIESIMDGESLDKPDTSVIHLTLQSEDLVDIWFYEDVCEDENDEWGGSDEECLQGFEELFGLDVGSLISVTMKLFFVLQKEGGRSLARSAYAPLWGTKPEPQAIFDVANKKFSVR